MAGSSSDRASQQTRAKWLCLNCGLEFQGAKTKPECPECFNKCDFLLVRLNREGLPAMSDEEEIMKEPELTLTLHTQDELEYKDELLDYIRRKNLARARRKMLEEEAEELKVKRELEKLQHGENGNFITDGGQNLSAAPLLITALAPTKEEREALLKELSENKELALALGMMLNAPRSTMPFFPFFAPPMQQAQQQTAVTDLAEALERLAKIAREERRNDGGIEELREELRELREALTKRDPVEDIKKLLEIRRELQELQGEEKGKREEVELLSKAVKEMGESVNKAISSLKATILRLEQERGGGSQEREIERAKKVMQSLKEYVDAAKELTNILSSSSGDGEDYYKRKKFEHELELERLEKEKELERERRKRERDMAIAKLLEMMRSKHHESDEEEEEEEEENEEDRFEIGSVEEEGGKGIEIEIGDEEEEEEKRGEDEEG